MTGKLLPFSHRSRSSSGNHRNNSRLRSPNDFSKTDSKPYCRKSNFKPPSRGGSPHPRASYSQNNSNNNFRPQSPHYNRDGNLSRQPISRNRPRYVRNYINPLFDQKQTDNTTPNTENTETQDVSEETLLEQQFNDLILQLNQDNKDEDFNCQVECITLTEEYIISTSC